MDNEYLSVRKPGVSRKPYESEELPPTQETKTLEIKPGGSFGDPVGTRDHRGLGTIGDSGPGPLFLIHTLKGLTKGKEAY